MSTEEQEILKKKATHYDFIKTWWPVIAVFFSAIGFTASGTHWFDKTVATKPDIEEVKILIKQQSQQIADLKSSFDAHVQTGNITNANIYRRQDSSDRILGVVVKRVLGHFVIEKYTRGRNNDPEIIPETN